MSDVRHVLVLPDRDAAEQVAALLAEGFSGFSPAEEPRLVRDALAGEDDAEDAQWLVVVEDPAAALPADRLEVLAARFDGWVE